MDANPAGARATRTRALRRRGAVCTVLIAAVALVSGVLPGSASAGNPTTPGSAQSKAASVQVGSGITVALPDLSVLGISLPVVTQLTNNVLTPLSTALTQLPTTVANGLANGLVSAGLSANSPTTQQPRPAAGSFPTCGQQGWTSSDCYGPVLPNVNLSPAANLSLGTVQGYATGDSQGYVAAATVANPDLSLLGLDLGNLGVIGSSAQCAQTAPTCSATQTFTGGSLFGGALGLSISTGGNLLAKVGNITVGSTAIPIPGTSGSVSLNGNLATITLPLSLTQLLTALGLPNLLSSSGLSLADNGTAVTLTVTIGPGSLSSGSPASAWGLDVSVNLAVDLKLKLTLGPLSLFALELTARGSGSGPDLLDLKLAYSTATAGTLLPGWVAPAVI